jgi:hypothetical protein
VVSVFLVYQQTLYVNCCLQHTAQENVCPAAELCLLSAHFRSAKSTTYILRQDYDELVVKLTSCTVEERDAVLASRKERTHDLQAVSNIFVRQYSTEVASVCE